MIMNTQNAGEFALVFFVTLEKALSSDNFLRVFKITFPKKKTQKNDAG